ncbi:hypothetical protein RND81_07G104000 [Saponaria officinalis]|uniref:Protein kinase domain-containing protein n=1 Tax=Saponaria officinalis TaxID=3572 RepID=A0AAW1JQ85_SAPOF
MGYYNANKYLLVLVLFVTNRFAISDPSQDEKQGLQSFLARVPHSGRVKWNSSQSPCDWVGVTCDSARSHVRYLRLPAAGLVGAIPENTIGRLSELRVLSIHTNRLTGQLPSDFSNLTFLRSLYAADNSFAGEFPASLTRLTRLTRLDLSNNNFSGSIPFSINNLANLDGLFLQNNNFSGQIPSISARLSEFNVSNNNLNGSIPATLSKFPKSSFAGNLQLCGGPLTRCNNSFFPAAPPSSETTVPSSPAEVHGKKKLSKGAIIGISIAAAAVLLGLLLCLIFCLLRRKNRGASKSATAKTRFAGDAAATTSRGGGEAGTSSSKDDLTSGTLPEGGERNKLVFLNGGGAYGGAWRFDLEDLLRASAEVLGKGSVGTSYKAVMEEGTTVVVKRLKEVVVEKKEFEVVMEVVGKCNKHENVVALRAYYFSKDEKLLVSDYLANGSLSALLHGSRGAGRASLDWDNRMKIAIGTARGLAYLHTSNNVVHGNIKSSNVLLRPNNEPAVSDFGLSALFSPNSTATSRIAGYRAPEVVETRKPTPKSDVYSFGVLLLELLTGKSPNQASLGDEGIDLPRWVQSVVREEWTAEVFDVELMRYHNIEEEMVQLLQIAMTCVSTVPDQRPTMPEALRMIEEMNRSGESATDDGIRQSSDDPSKGSDGHTPPLESRTPPSSVTP